MSALFDVFGHQGAGAPWLRFYGNGLSRVAWIALLPWVYCCVKTDGIGWRNHRGERQSESRAIDHRAGHRPAALEYPIPAAPARGQNDF